MSSALAIAGVSAVLRDLLNNGLIEQNVAGSVGVPIKVSIGPPDRVVPVGGGEATQLNLFFYHATPNSGWRNEELPERDAFGRRLSNPPLALDLHYLLSAHAGSDLHGEILLGYAMQLLHETPVLTRRAIQAALTPSPATGVVLPPTLRALADSGLADQLEQIRVTPEHLSTTEVSKLWTASLTHLRPTAAYLVSVVLIQASAPARAPLPTLTRGPTDRLTHRDRGVVVEAGLLPPVPTLESALPPGGQPAARLGEVIDLAGHHLDGSGRTVLLANDRFQIEQEIVAAPGTTGRLIQFSIPAAQAVHFPVGVYRVGARVQRPGDPAPRETNRVALTLAPEVSGLPVTVVRDAAGTADIRLHFLPALRAGQHAALLLGDREYPPEPFATATTTVLTFIIPQAPAAPAPGLLVRLRIDGIDSPIIDRTARPPVFRNQRIVIQ